jgi:CheY-like chemotaxis protein
MRKEDADLLLKKLENCRDRAEMRRLLQQADACRTCPEQHLLGGGLDECSCLLRFHTELKNSLDNILSSKQTLPGLKEWRGSQMKGAKILLVDDEVVFTNNMSKLLSRRGYQVKAVNSGDEAIRALLDNHFDVMILDLKMPGLDGISTLREVRKLGLSTEVLILTGHGSIDLALKAIQMGAYDWVTKPCEITELISKIEIGLEGKRSQIEKGHIYRST